ncbi:MAG: LacI family transcriptional regulator [Lachnospiraceae bacterium]|jgi:LacI family sucrose operon transcriptional repressor|nr:LacI family transcriptional regulator [Lachnospiraceae bacterium]
MAREKDVTFQDIANYTQFSKTTISRYFNCPESLSPANRNKIESALRALHYNENKVARILANGRTEFIGLIIPNIFNSFYSSITEKILASYERYGYKFLVFIGSPTEGNERRYIRELLAYKVEGLIVLSHTIPSMELASYGIPLVSIEREDRYISSVNTDNYMGGIQAASLLYKNNCDIFILLNSPTAVDVPSYGRVRGFLDTCSEHHLDYRMYEYPIGATYNETARAVENVLESSIIDAFPCKKKGIFCLSDFSAIIVLNYLFRKYGCLPDDYRIIGFDNIPPAREAVLPLSTIGQQSDALVDTAMELLTDQIRSHKENSGEPVKPVHRLIPPRLINRRTTD